MIPREAYTKYDQQPSTRDGASGRGDAFDMEGYLSKYDFELLRRKPWNSRPGSEIFEQVQCPFDPSHTEGSAAFTIADGVPGFACKHNGCHGKTIKDVFKVYPPDQRIRATPERKPVPQQERSGFKLARLSDLLNEPEEKIAWLLADKLPAGGISVLSAKPKIGKSTFARCLSLAVATGEPFLDCATTKGPVIYLALEEKRGEVRRHFADLGATGAEEIYIHAASAPQEAVLELCQVTKQMRPVLIVIDPLFKFVRIRDEKAYAEVCNAIEPLLTLARESGAHVLLSHHSGKMERADATDSILGSTAIFGGVDTAIILKKADRYRTVQSCQRYGTDWPELVLNFDPTERSLSLGVERSEAESGRIGEAIATYLASCDEPQTRVQIEAHVEGKTKHKRTALKALCAAGRVSESGAGAKGDPLRYALNPSTDSQAGNEPKEFVDSCSQVYAGTREQQSENGAEPRINTGDILVPSFSSESQSGADSGEQAFLEGKL